MINKLIRVYSNINNKKPKQWVFVIGCNNSGTTLLYNILATNKEVAHLPKEGHFLSSQLLIPKEHNYYRRFSTVDCQKLIQKNLLKVSLKTLIKDWRKHISNPLLKNWVEKTPANIYRIDWLRNNFIGAKFIFITREGIASSLSAMKYTNLSFKDSFSHWYNSNAEILKKFNKEDSILIKYENLCNNPTTELDQIRSFLRLKTNFNYPNHKIKNQNHTILKSITKEEVINLRLLNKKQLLKIGY